MRCGRIRRWRKCRRTASGKGLSPTLTLTLTLALTLTLTLTPILTLTLTCLALYFRALNNVCYGDDVAAHARKRRATQAGGREVAIAAMQAHPADYEVRWFGQRLLNRLQEGAGGHGTSHSPVLSRGFTRWQTLF